MRSLIWVAPLCAGLGACNATPDPIGLQPGETLLSVTGTGRTEATPDQALFTAGLSSIAADARGASERNARDAERRPARHGRHEQRRGRGAGRFRARAEVTNSRSDITSTLRHRF